MKPHTLISSDCHAAPPMKDYRTYVEPQYRADFDRWLEQSQKEEELSLKPSEYYERQCWAGASFMTRKECERRQGIGIDKIMFGTDYTHAEGVWPNTAVRLRHTFGGLPEQEVRPMLGLNAARVYGFDLEKLDAIAARIGPGVSDLQGGPTAEDLDKNGSTFLLR